MSFEGRFRAFASDPLTAAMAHELKDRFSTGSNASYRPIAGYRAVNCLPPGLTRLG
jgi:hypothetical protein